MVLHLFGKSAVPTENDPKGHNVSDTDFVILLRLIDSAFISISAS